MWGAASQPCPVAETHISIQKGQYSPTPGATFDLNDFAANLVSRGKEQPLCSMRTTEVEHGNVFVSTESLSQLFNQKAKRGASKISGIKIEIEKGTVHLKGKIRKGIDVPFDIEGSVATDGRNLILHATKVHAQGIPIKGVLNMLGMHLSSLMGSGEMSGVSAKEDTLVFEPAKISQVRGKIASATVSDKGLAVSFVSNKPQNARR